MKPSSEEKMIKVTDVAKWMVKMAIADGMLSPNEELVLAEFAQLSGLQMDALFDMIRKMSPIARPEVSLVDYKSKDGRDFENHIVGYLKESDDLELLEWTGDKYFEGIYDPRNLNPDLHLRWKKDDNTAFEFWVECKWRHHWMKDDTGHYFEMDKEQLRRYRKMAKEMKQKVFVAFAYGRTGNAPREVYIIPLRAFYNSRIMRDSASRYRIDDTSQAFAAEIKRHFARVKCAATS